MNVCMQNERWYAVGAVVRTTAGTIPEGLRTVAITGAHNSSSKSTMLRMICTWSERDPSEAWKVVGVGRMTIEIRHLSL